MERVGRQNQSQEHTMLKSIERAEKFSKISTVSAAVLAFLAGIVSLLTLIESVSLAMTWTATALAFISAICGVATLIFDKRKDTLEETLKKTRPELNVSIKTGQNNQNLYVVIEPINEVPFEYNIKIVTRENIMVSGIMLDWGKIYPDKKRSVVLHPAGINLTKVADNYIELRFDYRSVYAAELHDTSLTGKLVKSYKLSEDKKYCIPLE